MNPCCRHPKKTLSVAVVLLVLPCAAGTAQGPERSVYQPKLAVSETMEPFLKQLEPGNDGFALERQAQELDVRLRELSDALRGGAARSGAQMSRLLDPAFRGARLAPPAASAAADAPLDVKRATDLPRDATLDARAFGAELRRLVDDMREVVVAELLITSIEAEGSSEPPSGLRTRVRYDLVGAGTKAYRVEQIGEWD